MHCKIKSENQCFSLYLGNEKRYRTNFCGFEIPEKQYVLPWLNCGENPR